MGENELYHYGVLGMKWGVRKDRNKSGKKKAKLVLESPFKPKPKSQPSSSSSSSSSKKSISDMSDDELRALINRMQLERQYKQMMAQPPSKGKAFVKKFLAENAQTIAKTAISKYANRVIDQQLDKKFGKQSDKDKNKSSNKNT